MTKQQPARRGRGTVGEKWVAKWFMTTVEKVRDDKDGMGKLAREADAMVSRAVKKRTDDIVKICRARQANPNTSLASSGDIGQIVRDIIKL